MMTHFTDVDLMGIVKRTDAKLKDSQTERIPHVHKLQLEVSDSYIYNNEIYKLNDDDLKIAKIFKSHDFPFLTNANRYGSFIFTLRKAVNKELVMPMILTKVEDGETRAISWDDIVIVKDDVNVYIVIYNIDTEIAVDNIKCLLLPFTVKYKTSLENEDEFPEIGFVFDSEGLAVYDKYRYYQAAMVIDISNKYLKCKEFSFEGDANGFVATFNGGRVFKDSAVVYYKNNLIINNEKYIEYLDNNIFKFNNPEDAINTFVRVFYSTAVDESIDNIYTLPEEGFTKLGMLRVNDEVPDKCRDIFNKLDLSNIQDPVEKEDKIIKYRKSIKYPANVNTDNNANHIYSYEIKGKDILRSQNDETGLSTLITGRWKNDDGLLDDVFYPIIFSNNRLYSKYGSIKRVEDDKLHFTVNANKITADDDIEMYYIGQALETTEETIVVTKDTAIECSLDLTDCMLFEKEPTPINYPDIVDDPNACFQYSINFECEKTDDGLYRITFENDKYYDTEVVAVSNRQFLVYSDISEDGENVCINLPESFKYAQNIDHYMVFTNGKKIDNEDLIFNFPKEDNPFPYISIYSTVLFGDGDDVTVIYMPYSVKTVYKADSIPSNGIIKFDDDFLPCGINTENMLVFINGNKVSNSEINIISDNIMQIRPNTIDSTKNLSIVIPDIMPALPTELYKSDDWNKIIDNLLDSDLDILYSGVDIKDTDPDMNDNKVARKAVLLEIFRDYYADLYDGSPFEYDGNEEILDVNDRDIDMNYLVHIANASKKNSVNFNKLG